MNTAAMTARADAPDPADPATWVFPAGTGKTRPSFIAPDWPPPVGTRVRVVHGVWWTDHEGGAIDDWRKWAIGKEGRIVGHNSNAFGGRPVIFDYLSDYPVCNLPCWMCPVVEFQVTPLQVRRHMYAWPDDLAIIMELDDDDD